MRVFWGSVGILAVVLALTGAVLPILPTVPFLLLAAFAFDRSSPRFHGLLMAHPVFGRQIREWREHGAIASRVKVLAIGGMAVGLGVSAFVLPVPLWLAQVTVLTLVALFIATRPVPPPAGLRAEPRMRG